jgi:hypothetical protein
MSDIRPEVQTLSSSDRKICDDLADWYQSQSWEEDVSPARIRDKNAWDRKIIELGKMDIAREVWWYTQYYAVYLTSLCRPDSSITGA